MTSQHQSVDIEEQSSPAGVPSDPAREDDDTRDLRFESAEAELQGSSDLERGASYLADETCAEASKRWQGIQAEFVDDPRRSVAGAHELVSELMQRIVDGFAKDRGELERQWSKGDNVSTEELRVRLQRYRSFFNRLLREA